MRKTGRELHVFSICGQEHHGDASCQQDFGEGKTGGLANFVVKNGKAEFRFKNQRVGGSQRRRGSDVAQAKLAQCIFDIEADDRIILDNQAGFEKLQGRS